MNDNRCIENNFLVYLIRNNELNIIDYKMLHSILSFSYQESGCLATFGYKKIVS